MVYVQTIISGARAGLPDPQTDLHTDTFHPTVKAWLFLTDVAPDAMPFVYVPGSHRLTPQRLDWERRMSIAASQPGSGPAGGAAATGWCARSRPRQLAELGLPPPRAIAVPANTLVVADTFGFHARGASARPTTRVEIWAMGAAQPVPAVDRARPVVDRRRSACASRSCTGNRSTLLERLGIGRQRWRARGDLSAFDPA